MMKPDGCSGGLAVRPYEGNRAELAKKRGPYKPDATEDLKKIERRRIAAGVSLEELAGAADLTHRNLMYIRKSGRAFKRTIRALSFAVRTLERQKREAEEQ